MVISLVAAEVTFPVEEVEATSRVEAVEATSLAVEEVTITESSLRTTMMMHSSLEAAVATFLVEAVAVEATFPASAVVPVTGTVVVADTVMAALAVDTAMEAVAVEWA